MILIRHSSRTLAAIALGLFVLIACQNATEPSSSSGPVVVTGSYTMGSSSRLPDSIAWTSPKDTGSQKQNCNAATRVCSDTFHLSEPLGTDLLAVQLWTLGSHRAGVTGRSGPIRGPARPPGIPPGDGGRISAAAGPGHRRGAYRRPAETGGGRVGQRSGWV